MSIFTDHLASLETFGETINHSLNVDESEIIQEEYLNELATEVEIASDQIKDNDGILSQLAEIKEEVEENRISEESLRVINKLIIGQRGYNVSIESIGSRIHLREEALEALDGKIGTFIKKSITYIKELIVRFFSWIGGFFSKNQKLINSYDKALRTIKGIEFDHQANKNLELSDEQRSKISSVFPKASKITGKVIDDGISQQHDAITSMTKFIGDYADTFNNLKIKHMSDKSNPQTDAEFAESVFSDSKIQINPQPTADGGMEARLRYDFNDVDGNRELFYDLIFGVSVEGTFRALSKDMFSFKFENYTHTRDPNAELENYPVKENRDLFTLSKDETIKILEAGKKLLDVNRKTEKALKSAEAGSLKALRELTYYAETNLKEDQERNTADRGFFVYKSFITTLTKLMMTVVKDLEKLTFDGLKEILTYVEESLKIVTQSDKKDDKKEKADDKAAAN